LPYVAAESDGKLEVLLDKDAVMALGGKTELFERALRDAAALKGLELR
jgi:hypothetical protein